MKTAIIYTRVSTEEQVDGLSLTSQDKACREYASRNGYIVTEAFCEEGASAKTTDRKKLIEMLAYCKKHKGSIDALIVWKVDRFARRSEDHHMLKAYLQRVGVKLLSVTEPIEDSNTGRLMESMLAAFAQFDNEVRTERAVDGLNGRAEEGGWITRAPLGYSNTRDDQKRPTLAIDHTRSAFIQRVFEQYASGNYTLKSMREYAYGIGLRTRANKKLHEQPLLNLLRNNAYRGYRKSRTSGELIKCLHTPLVSEDIFQEVQMVLDGKRKGFKPEKDENWPLRGFVLCADCGNPIWGSNVKGRSNYYSKYSCGICRTSVVGHTVSVDRDEMHTQFLALLNSIAPKKRHAELFKMRVISVWSDEYKEMSDEKKLISTELDILQKRRDRIMELFIDDNLTIEEKNEQMEKIDGKRTVLRIKLSELDQDVEDREKVIEVAMDFLNNTGSYWDEAPLLIRRRFQKLVFPDGIKYEFGKGFRTAKLAPAYGVIGRLKLKKSALAGETGYSWNQLRSHLLEIYKIIHTNNEVSCRTQTQLYSVRTSEIG